MIYLPIEYHFTNLQKKKIIKLYKKKYCLFYCIELEINKLQILSIKRKRIPIFRELKIVFSKRPCMIVFARHAR